MAEVGRVFVLKAKYETVEALNKAIAAYFAQCKKNKKPATMERLAEFLDCSDRTLMRYKDLYDKWEGYLENEEDAPEGLEFNNEKLKFCHPIKKAYQRIKAEDIERLKIRGNSGDIFIAKNHGYTDKQEREINLNVESKLEDFIK